MSATGSTHLTIDPLTAQSLLLRIYSGETYLSSATGFLVQKGSNNYLVTNAHVFNGQSIVSDRPYGQKKQIPTAVGILHNSSQGLGSHVILKETLIGKDGIPLWIMHPSEKSIDIAFLRLTNTTNVSIYRTSLELRNTPIRLSPASSVSIIRFPYGEGQIEGFPIWKSGTIASDPDLDYEGTPQMLVDCTGRPGMSGSPVYARRIGSYVDENGSSKMFAGTADRFVGIYAGSIDKLSEIGRVFKASAIMEIYSSIR